MTPEKILTPKKRTRRPKKIDLPTDYYPEEIAENGLSPFMNRIIHHIIQGMSKAAAYKLAYKESYLYELKIPQNQIYQKVNKISKNEKFCKALREAREAQAYRLDLSVDRLLAEEMTIAFSDIKRIFDGQSTPLAPKDLPQEVSRAIKRFKVRHITDPNGNTKILYDYELYDKGKSLERLERYLGIFEKDNQQKQLGDGVNIKVLVVGDQKQIGVSDGN